MSAETIKRLIKASNTFTTGKKAEKSLAHYRARPLGMQGLVLADRPCTQRRLYHDRENREH